MSETTTETTTDVAKASDQKRAEVERFVSDSGVAIPGSRELSSLWRMSQAYAHMPGLAKSYAGNPQAVMAAALTAHSLDLPVNPVVINQFYEVNGRLFPSTQILIALGAKHGVEVWFDEGSNGEWAKAYCRRRGDERVHSYEYTIDMARKASGGTDRGGKAISLADKDVWKSHPEIMLRYRASSRLMRTVCPDVTLGIPRNVMDGDMGAPPVSREQLEAMATPAPVVDDDEIVDGEIVDEPAPTPAKAAKKASGGTIPKPDTTPCRVNGCAETGKHTHDSYVEREYADDDPERPFD